MTTRDYIAHQLIGSPLESVVRRLLSLKRLPKRIKHPEMREIYAEAERTEQALERIITPSMNCIDIGAHLGSVLHYIKQQAPQGTHTAIEPIPYKNGWLRRKFPDVAIHQVALSHAVGEAQFYFQRHRSGFSGLNFHVLPIDRDNQDVELLNVKLARLDDLVPADLPIGFIKIDIEGAELPALKGAEGLLNRWKPKILFECTKSGLKANSITQSEMYDFFQTHGYSIFLIKDWLANRQSLDYETFLQAMDYPFQAFNFLAIPQT